MFAKHPYDVGDKVIIDNINLEVLEIFLMHTVFRKNDGNGVKVQIPHTKAQEYWIDNVSRTEHEDQQQKTREAGKGG